MKLGRRYADVVCSSVRFGTEDGKEAFRTEMWWKGCTAWIRRSVQLGGKAGARSPSHVAIDAAAAEQLAQVSGQVVAAVVLLDAREPVAPAGTYEHVFAIVGDETVQRRCAVYLEPFGHLRSRGAGACRRRAGGNGREWWWCSGSDIARA